MIRETSEEEGVVSLRYILSRGNFSFERSNLPTQLLVNSENNPYMGDDIKMLDDIETRYPWERDLLIMLYDEKKEQFTKVQFFGWSIGQVALVRANL